MKATAQEKDSYYLCWVEDSVRRSRKITNDETIVGRRTDCHVVINNPYVSRRHARIVFENDAYKLVDLDSRFGTFLRGVRI
ncbi:MAG TPA: FHA domain-containing protein, partial [Terriglobia bacterium]|nr:FHA domain-containing protein [Terriglobia bacterium]